jgi:DNA-nicking Smr family endonuclease
MSRRRQLSDDEQALWRGLARSITPLRKSKEPAKLSDVDGEPVPVLPTPQMTPRKAAPPTAQTPPLVPLDRRLKQRVARGREPIDDRIDLHGKTQAQAHAALLRFMRFAQANGCRFVLVVTGKGTSRGEQGFAAERGVLKRQVPMWLALPEFRPFIVGFEDAHVSHGGQGALYVRIRQAR